jgi:hypothetical protein
MEEAPIASILRYLRELAGFRLARKFSMFLCNVIGGYKEHEAIKIRLYIFDVLYDHLKYRNSCCALISLGNKVTSFIDEAFIGDEGPVAPDIVPSYFLRTLTEDICYPIS